MAEGPSDANGTSSNVLYSRYCPIKTIPGVHLHGSDGCFTCVRYMPKDKNIIVGTYKGKILQFDVVSDSNANTRSELFDVGCGEILHIEPNKTGKFILSSAGNEESYVSHLWHIGQHAPAFTLDGHQHVEFGKKSQNIVIGTEGNVAKVYDVATGNEKASYTPTESNGYTINKATFSMDDQLILTDGVLFNANSKEQIHRFEKSNDTQSEVFHPDGSKIISNSRIYDIRTYGLLETVPILDHCGVIFCSDVIYTKPLVQISETGIIFQSCFTAANITDYSIIAAINVWRDVYDVAVNSAENQLAVVANQGPNQGPPGRWAAESEIQLLDVTKPTDEDKDKTRVTKLQVLPF